MISNAFPCVPVLSVSIGLLPSSVHWLPKAVTSCFLAIFCLSFHCFIHIIWILQWKSFVCVFWFPFNSLFATFANLHVRKLATFANLQLYTHLLFIRIAQWSDYHWFWFALCACIINLAFGVFPYDLQVQIYSKLKIVLPKWRPNSSAPQNNVAHGRFVRGKQRVKEIHFYLSCLPS